MNKYQSFYINCIERFNVISLRAKELPIKDQNNIRNRSDIKREKERDQGTDGCTFKDGVYTIYQNDNYYLKQYLVVVCSSLECEVYLKFKDKEVPIKRHEEYIEEHHFTLDFDNRAESIIVKYNTKLIDSIEIPILYVESDKEERDKKLEEERIANMRETVGVQVVGGNAFVNVFYKPLNESYDYAEIDLYFVNNSNQTKNNYFLAKYKSSPNTYFINIPNLSYGEYEFELRQYDRNNKLIYYSSKEKFMVRKDY